MRSRKSYLVFNLSLGMKNTKIAVLISGGLDSAVLLAWALARYQTVYPIYVTSHHFWEKAEKNHLTRLMKSIRDKKLKPLTILSSPTQDISRNFWAVTGKKVPGKRSKDEAVYLPGKNVLLIAKTAVFCAERKINEIALGVLKTNPFPDATAEFFNHYEDALSEGLGLKVKIRVPFLTKTKKEVMKMGEKFQLGVTFSCIHPTRNKHCGKCNKCAERQKAFKLIGMKDPTLYTFPRRVSRTAVSR